MGRFSTIIFPLPSILNGGTRRPVPRLANFPRFGSDSPSQEAGRTGDEKCVRAQSTKQPAADWYGLLIAFGLVKMSQRFPAANLAVDREDMRPVSPVFRTYSLAPVPCIPSRSGPRDRVLYGVPEMWRPWPSWQVLRSVDALAPADRPGSGRPEQEAVSNPPSFPSPVARSQHRWAVRVLDLDPVNAGMSKTPPMVAATAGVPPVAGRSCRPPRPPNVGVT
jgi:hypothetical protein